MYSCKECGASAEVVSGEVVKTCECKCAVVADMASALYGEGKIKN